MDQLNVQAEAGLTGRGNFPSQLSNAPGAQPDVESLADYPGLSRLHLAPIELEALRIQGHVSCERRGNGQIFKLRFRVRNKQVVRYISSSRERADEVVNELESLQRDRALDLALYRTMKLATQALRNGKKSLEPMISKFGLHFHGYELRRRKKDQ
jgi:hypothetical protein